MTRTHRIITAMLVSLVALTSSQRLESAEAQIEKVPAVLSDLLHKPRTKFFAVERTAAGQWSTGHSESYYAAAITNDAPVFTVGNGALVASVTPAGVVKEIRVFGPTVPQTGRMGGTWVRWARTVVGPMNWQLELNGQTNNLTESWPCRTSFLANVLPVTEYKSSDLAVEVIACAPISADGRARPRAMLWMAHLENLSSATIHGALLVSAPSSMLVRKNGGTFTLKPGESIMLPVSAAAPGDQAALDELNRRDAATWLTETLAYWRRVNGEFKMPGDPFTAELFTRLTILALESGVFNQKGEVSGVLYGVYPIRGTDNFRDMYYAILPAVQRDPKLLQPIIEWFARYAVHPVDTNFPGGISHSLGNALNGPMLAGLYFDATGDRELFARNPELTKTLRGILEQVLASRKSDGPWLFPSHYISDGKSVGDYHTGSNVCAWRAFDALGRLFDDARYREIAFKIKADLDKHNILPGPFGPQYVEGTDADGSVPVRMHDGEESDTTLMPFYGYCAVDSPAYRNFMRFAATTNNVAFCAETRGIVWENYGPNAPVKPAGPHMADATYPGYLTALAGCADVESLRGADGYLTEIRRLTDVNGSWWWWPYGRNAKRGRGVLRAPFECGWAEGEFAVLFPSNFLGIHYDAPMRTLTFNPLAAIGDFEWKDFPIGFDRFSMSYENGVAMFKNSTTHPVTLVPGSAAPIVVSAGETTTVRLTKSK